MGKFIDMTGWVMKDHGIPDSKITVLHRVEDYLSPKGYPVAQWKCRCNCGTIFISSGNNIRNGITKSCGCLQKEVARNMVFKDITGQRFGKLEVMYLITDNSQSKEKRLGVWHCRCDCGNEKDILGTSLRHGSTQSCGCYQRERASQLNEKLRIRDENGIIIQKKCSCCGQFKNISDFYHNKTTADGYSGICKSCTPHKLGRRFHGYKLGAKKRDLVFDITLDEFDEITKKPCMYCGDYSGEYFGVQFSGIDRIDSGKGYIKGNIVPCCNICNKMKMELDINIWLRKIEQIAKRMEVATNVIKNQSN